jgi:hypothetical protein
LLSEDKRYLIRGGVPAHRSPSGEGECDLMSKRTLPFAGCLLPCLVAFGCASTPVGLSRVPPRVTPLDPQFPGPKLVDGFGRTGNQFVTIPVTQNRVFANSDLDPPLEPTGDVLRAPDQIIVPSASDLDIADWRVEVRRP